MPEWSTITVFAAAALVLLATPGPAVLYIVARSVDQGRAAGFASVVGLGVGTLAHITAAALGVSALLATSAAAFAAVKYAGAAYLVYLGVRKLREPDAAPAAEVRLSPGASASLASVVRQAVVVNVLNPKAALFFLAFLPQFVAPSRGPALPQVLTLGGVFLALSLLTDSAYVLLASGVGRWVRARLVSSGRARRVQRYVVGGTYLGLGAAAALTGRRAD